MVFNIMNIACAQRINVADYGAVPDTHKDAVPAIKRAIAACRKLAQPVLYFPKGQYDLYPDSAEKREYFLSNTSSETECPSKIKTIGILLEGIKDLTIEGNGSMLMYHGRMITFALDHSSRITIQNLEEDYERPTMSEFTITNVTPESIQIQVHPDSWYRLDDGKLSWYGEGWVAQNSFCIRIDSATGAMYYANDEYTALSKMQTKEEAPMHLSFQGNVDTSKYHAGDVYTIRDPNRDEVGLLILNSRDVTLKEVAMHYMHGLGILSQFSGNITMRSVGILPRKGSGRRIASFADGMHFSGCKGSINIEQCVFTGLHDDAINVHGTHLKIIKRPSDRTMVVRFMHPQTYGFQAFWPGDSVAFVHPATLAIYNYSVVKDIQRLSDREWLLTMKKPTSAAPDDVVENITWTPSLTVRRNVITGTQTRGMLVTTRRKVIIEDNTFYRVGMHAILIADDALSWYESGPVNDVTIRRNVFTLCGHNILPNAYVIAIAPENHQLTDTPVHHNIRIVNNTFDLLGAGVVTARSVEGLTLSANSIKRGDKNKWFHQEACKNVTISNNQYIQ